MSWLTEVFSPARRLRAIAAALLLMAASPVAAQAEGGGLMSPGDAVVTGFSGTLPPPDGLPGGTDPLDYTFIDPDGSSMQVQRFLPAGPPTGQLIEAPALVTAPARAIGQVFSVTLDDAPAPNIYVGATSSFGIHIVAPGDDGTLRHVRKGTPRAQFMEGQWGADKGGSPGSIYRMDGATGEITLFSSIGSNAGPGLGDVVFDRATRQFYASDLDTGLIYRLDSAGIIAGTFDHGAAGRIAGGLPPVNDDGSRMDIASLAFNSEDPGTWGVTRPERRVGGMAVHGGRLYYAIAEGPQVWSVGIELDGSFRADARWELDVAGLASGNPVTDIAFDAAGRMILAQRGSQRGSFDYSVFAEPKTSSVVRYAREVPDDPATPGTWVPVPDEYAVGFRPEQLNTAGGVALGYGYDANGALRGGSCNAFLWTTGEALRDDPALADRLSAGGPAIVDGLQGNDASLVKPANTPPSGSYFTDYDGSFDHPERQGWMGDVEVYQPCEGSHGYLPPPFYFPPGHEPPPSGSFNLTLDKEATPKVCLPGGLGWLCHYTVRVTNTGTVPYWGPLTVRDWTPMPVPGAVMSFDFQPPWLCAALGPSGHECTLPGTFLWPGDSVDLFVTVEQPIDAIGPREVVNSNICHVGNGAEIFWWDGHGDANPWDDLDYAEAQIPDEDCLPQGNGTNLTITKHAVHDRCQLQAMPHDVWNCEFLIIVTNTGEGTYNGPISVVDELSVDGAVDYGPQPNPPGWNCVAGGGGSYTCNHAPVSLIPGESVVLWFSAKVPAREQEAANRCSLVNRVRITDAPGGSIGNADAGDDSAQAEAQTPGPNCQPQQGRKSDLSITKEPKGCAANPIGFTCAYQVIVKNEGPDEFSGVVTVHDELVAGFEGVVDAGHLGVWACVRAGNALDCSLDAAAMPLAAAESRSLLVLIATAPPGRQTCEISNQARITAPAGGTDANSDAGNDVTGVVSQAIPDPRCNPPEPAQPQANLSITKEAVGCAMGEAPAPPESVTCKYRVTVQNHGPGDVNGPVVFNDAASVLGPTGATPDGGQPGWACDAPGQMARCVNPAGMSAGASATFNIEVATTADQVRSSQCRVVNQAWISQPVGAPLNGLLADDVSAASANGPAEICPEARGRRSDLSITKEGFSCDAIPGSGDYNCGYLVTVENEGPDDFIGVLTIHDEPTATGVPPVFWQEDGLLPAPCAVSAGAGFDCTHDFAARPLAVGHIYWWGVGLLVPANSQFCEMSNQAYIKSPVGGTDVNSDAGNDASDIVTLMVPLPRCIPQQAPQSNLMITQRATGYSVANREFYYDITVKNTGPGDVNEPVAFNDKLVMPEAATVWDLITPPGWICSDPGQVITCTNPAGVLAGATSTFNVVLRLTQDQLRDSQCRVVNEAWISRPVGGPLNSVADDDSSQATIDMEVWGPLSPSHCLEMLQGPIVDVCPAERQMPDQGCCPEGQKWNGKSCSAGGATAKVCPSGSVGKYPDCRCPKGTIGKWPNCERNKPENTSPNTNCPEGYVYSEKVKTCVRE